MKQLFAIAGLALALSACQTTGGDDLSSAAEFGRTAATSCLEGDHLVASANMCLQDDAACYAIASGQYCTGPRTASCPQGSQPLPAGSSCPESARCFAQSESLQCVIGG